MSEPGNQAGSFFTKKWKLHLFKYDESKESSDERTRLANMSGGILQNDWFDSGSLQFSLE